MAPRTAPHGGNLRALAAQAGCGPENILDFSANINPLGPPPWLRSVVAGALWEVWGPQWTFLAGAGFAGMALLSLLPLRHRLDGKAAAKAPAR